MTDVSAQALQSLDDFLYPEPVRVVDPLLDAIAAQARQADDTRTIDPRLIAALKASDVLRLAASENLGGTEASILQIGRELEAVAARCTSTAWTLWNHLGVFHLYVGSLGPAHQDLLRGIVERGEWVCFPGGAGSGVRGVIDGDHIRLDGRGTFGSGGRYADWAGVVCAITGADGKRIEPLDLRFTIVPIAADGVRITPTWDGSAVRASATDDIWYDGVVVPLDRTVPWFGANRAESLRSVPVVAHRYREDWVGLSDLFLGWMGIGLVRSALSDAIDEIRTRRAIMGKAMVSRPTIQVNLGTAAALLASAAATMTAACIQVDQRIEHLQVPSEADYLRQMALTTSALDQLSQAMSLLLRCQGGNGLRESGSFDRRWRDFQAMPLHINAHQDRVHHQLGRFVLDEPLEAF
ncbi:MAG: acyl-CoA dehydrogenase family protein [Actinomycetota bacterium]|nr:acyl-CoA dehydrogenase family protein [Actinomycetota bacterium]